jgi:exodeoxyribonuclease V gamma subunit
VRALLADRLAGRPTRANFRTGHLTVCTLVPMRSVPHRVVCLLGLDDGLFPRRLPRDGDDLLLEAPRLGERDPRSEDRQLLLDAVMACTERLIITYTGHDERTNAPRPPAVPVGELLDLVTATARGATGSARDQVLVTHPLQPFDPRNFRPLTTPGRPWSFDSLALSGARALGSGQRTRGPFLTRALPALDEPVIELSELVRFFSHPVRAFLRRRLGISLWSDSDEVRDALPVELDGLDRWAVGQRLLEARLRGVSGRQAIRAEIARGALPPGVLGKPIIDGLYPIVDAIVTAARGCVATGAPTSGDPIDVRVTLDDGRLVSGTVAGISGNVMLTTTFSRVSPRHRLSAWISLLALSATVPERATAAATVGRGAQADDVRVARFAPLGVDRAERERIGRRHLAGLIDIFDRGMREPLPLSCATAAAYGQAAHSGQDGVQAARAEWESGFGHDREDRQAEHQLAFGGVLTLADLLDLPPLPGADPEPSDPAEPSRLGRLARRLWDPLLSAEQVRAR